MDIKEAIPDWLLKRAGYSENDIKIYKDLRAMPLRSIKSDVLAEGYLLIRNIQDEEKKVRKTLPL